MNNKIGSYKWLRSYIKNQIKSFLIMKLDCLLKIYKKIMIKIIKQKQLAVYLFFAKFCYH